MRHRLAAFVVLLCAASPALAQDASPNVITPTSPPSRGAPAAGGGGNHPLLRRFEAANTTHDGHLTLAQAQAAPLPRVAKNFGAIDADHKGYVTIQDIRTFAVAHRGQGKGQGATQAQ